MTKRKIKIKKMSYNILKVTVIGILVYTLSGCTEESTSGASLKREKRDRVIVASLYAGMDTLWIDEQELRYRKEVAYAYGYTPATFQNTEALINAISEGIEYLIARRYKVAPTTAQIDSFSHHADVTTKKRELLEAVKNVFGKDTHAYWFIYLQPKLTNPFIRHYYGYHSAYHQKEYNCIQAVFEILKKDPNVFQKVKDQFSRECALEYSHLAVVKEGKSSPRESKDLMVIPEYIIGVRLDSLKDGELYPRIHEDLYSFSVWRLIKRRDYGYEAEVLAIGKKVFDDWLKQEAKSIQIEIKDKGLLEEIKRKYGNMWWLENVKEE